MTARTRLGAILTAALLALGMLTISAGAQGPGSQGFPGGGQGRQGGPGMGGPNQPERKIVDQFDRNGDKRLNADERRAARAWLESQPSGGPGGARGPRGRGPGGMGRGGEMPSGTPGARLALSDVRSYGAESFYDVSALRTLFLQFENDDWEQEMAAFYNTDVEVPATLTVDGKVHRDVGVHFRGASSFFGVPAGLKRSLNVSLDFVHGSQNIQGYTTLNLLNSHEDPTYLRSVLYLAAAREYVPAPRANYVRVVLNGESWGIYVNAQQFNKSFVNEWFKTTDGARWKVPGSPQGRGGLEYLGDDSAAYKRVYEIKTKDDAVSWAAFIRLCRMLNTTPPEQLEKALAPMLDIDGALKFLALEVALVNGDGYWTRASDYNIYLDPKGVFHVMPHDANETFGRGRGGPGPPPGGGGMPPGRMGRGGMPPGGGPELDPLIGLDDAAKPLRSKLLAVPELRARYLGYVRQIATKWLDWNTVGPMADRYQALIAEDVRKDTRKLSTAEAFESGLASLKTFAERRRTYLLNFGPR